MNKPQSLSFFILENTRRSSFSLHRAPRDPLVLQFCSFRSPFPLFTPLDSQNYGRASYSRQPPVHLTCMIIIVQLVSSAHQ